MTDENSVWRAGAVLLAVGSAFANLTGCSSTSCVDTDSCGAYPQPNVCDGGICIDSAAVDVGQSDVDPDVDDAIDAALDVEGGRPRDDAARDTTADPLGDPNADTNADPTCDVTKSPVDAPCLVDDRYGVFVSPAGSDAAGAGTKTSPYASVTKGIAAARGKNVYACAGTYAEALAIEGALDGTRLFGGFDCTSWVYAAAKRALIKPATGTPLIAKNLTKGLRVEDIEFDAPVAAAKGESSFGAWIASSVNVKFARVKLVASAAQPGADGGIATNYDVALLQSDVKIAGHNASGQAGGDTQTCSNLCANNVSATGGKGGNGGPGIAGDAGAGAGAATAGANGAPAITPVTPAGANGAGGSPKSPANVSCSNGIPGSNALAKPGGVGAAQPGTLTPSGWTRADGVAGTGGGPGQGGGGGGGGENATTGGGGGGGCGGCGGAAGQGGQSGGSSFALLSYQSTIALDACTLVAGAAGNGGKGADGQVGQLGGLGANGTQPGCPGAAGGQGGQGGGGGGGAGGHSAAIGYVGTLPTLINGTTTEAATQVATAGAAGANGTPLATAGAVGKTLSVLALP